MQLMISMMTLIVSLVGCFLQIVMQHRACIAKRMTVCVRLLSAWRAYARESFAFSDLQDETPRDADEDVQAKVAFDDACDALLCSGEPQAQVIGSFISKSKQKTVRWDCNHVVSPAPYVDRRVSEVLFDWMKRPHRRFDVEAESERIMIADFANKCLAVFPLPDDDVVAQGDAAWAPHVSQMRDVLRGLTDGRGFDQLANDEAVCVWVRDDEVVRQLLTIPAGEHCYRYHDLRGLLHMDTGR